MWRLYICIILYKYYINSIHNLEMNLSRPNICNEIKLKILSLDNTFLIIVLNKNQNFR